MLSVLSQYDDGYTFIDLFGGSGLMAHTVKFKFPKARVVYNDFDDFHIRLQNIDKTNELLSRLRDALKDCPHDLRIDDMHKSKVLELLSDAEYVDWITVSSSVLFAMNYALSVEEMSAQTLYNRIKQTGYRADGYLEGMETVKLDYRKLFARYGRSKCVFIIDPPYLSTDVKTYSADYWKLKDYLDVIAILKGVDFIYFTSEKSNIVELCEWLDANGYSQNPFCNAKTERINGSAGMNAQYEDIVYYTVNENYISYKQLKLF
jgi:16S rRNA G966 N2-methylase RsmD